MIKKNDLNAHCPSVVLIIVIIKKCNIYNFILFIYGETCRHLQDRKWTKGELDLLLPSELS